ncbi:COG4 transport protein-domain-containing protein [Paraphysoderma sedebokerense]|nr:COG4 transport protein-domain-containing protein [Paraphysoderma sedebokerense]
MLSHKNDVADSVASSLSIDGIKQLTNITEIQNQLELLNREESIVDEELDAILNRRTLINKKLRDLEILKPEFTLIQRKTIDLSNIITDAADLAEKISGTIRNLDHEQNKIQAAIKRVEVIQELKACIAGVQKAMSEKNYESAATFIHRYLSYEGSSSISFSLDEIVISPTLLPSSETSKFASTSSNALTVMEEAKNSMREIVLQEFQSAVDNGREADILKYFKLFPLVGEIELGLSKYSNYVCALLSRKCQDAIKLAAQQEHSFHIGLLTRLFENIASLIDNQSPIIESHYGPGSTIRLIQRLHREAEVQAQIIIDSWMEKRQFQRRVSEIPKKGKRSTDPGHARLSSTDNTSDVRDLDIILTELALTSQRYQLYSRFIHSRSLDEVKTLRSQDPNKFNKPFLEDLESNKSLGRDGLAITGVFDQLMQQLMSSYIALEEDFLKRSIEKAMAIDEHDPDNQISSCVDDVFFILKKCYTRSISTSDIDTVCAMINVYASIIEENYMMALQSRANEAASLSGKMGVNVDVGIGMGISVSTDKEVAAQRLRHLVYLNDIDMSCSYLPRMSQDIDNVASETFQLSTIQTEESLSETPETASIAKNRDKIQSCLTSITDMEKTFRSLLKTQLESLFSTNIKSKLAPLLREAFKDIITTSSNQVQSRYILTETEYTEMEVNQIFVGKNQRWIHGFDRVMGFYKKSLTTRNYSQILINAVEFTVHEWEKYILQTKFNMLGALQLDKDIRSLSQFFTSRQEDLNSKFENNSMLSNYSIQLEWSHTLKEKFTRLSQLALVLNLETVDEIFEYWGASSNVNWRLSSSEVKRILGLRVDFKAEEINKLKL